MMEFRLDGKGTYKISNDQITFTGTATEYIDDGYKKGSNTLNDTTSFKFRDGMIVVIDAKGEPSYFRKEGSGPPPQPRGIVDEHDG